jgi:hypothetical protein
MLGFLVRRGLTRRFPRLERVHLESLLVELTGETTPAQEIEHLVMMYPENVLQVFGKAEQDVQQNISSLVLSRDLGIEPSAEAINRGSHRSSLIQWEILRRHAPFIVLLEESKVVGVIDRVKMANDIAVRAFEEPVA